MNCLRCLSLKRSSWLAVSGFAVFLVIFAHAVFQKWLFMEPCEQCVYIRFAFVLVAIGALLVALKPSNFFFSLPGLAVSLYGALYGLSSSLQLAQIHAAMHSEESDAFLGIEGCSTSARYPFDLPLDVWFPDWFAATGECGIDAPVVPSNTILSGLQAYFVDLYKAADGWYLIPSLQWGNMAECCAVFSVVFLLVFLALGFGLLWRKKSRSDEFNGI